jgi:hypothetical protein
MNRLKEVLQWLWQEPVSVRDATFEKLFSGDYPDDQAYFEIVRRLKPIVRAMALRDNPITAEQVSNNIFVEYSHLFPGDPPEGGLRRLAAVIRNTIGDSAFAAGEQAAIFYTQIALYHIPERKLRDCLEFLCQKGFHCVREQSLAEEFGVTQGITSEDAEGLFREAWSALGILMRDKFQTEDWKRWTEGYLSWARN